MRSLLRPNKTIRFFSNPKAKHDLIIVMENNSCQDY